MRTKFTKAAVVLAGIAAATTISMGGAQAEGRKLIVPDHATCERKGMEATNGQGPWMCTERPDGTWLLEIG